MTKYSYLTKQCFVFILFSIAIALASCQTGGCPPSCSPPTKSIVHGAPRYHTWDLLLRDGAEVRNYAMYTYVLFGQRVNTLDEVTHKRYQSLLDAIVSITPSAAEGSKFPKEESNVFYIPYNNVEVRDNLAIKDYNSGLSLNFISRLRHGIQGNLNAVDRLGSRPGPFLVSVFEPLGTNDKIVSLLYADLSDVDAVLTKEIVAAYKVRIDKASVNDIERFSSFRLTLLGFIVDANRNLQVIQSAFAGPSPDK